MSNGSQGMNVANVNADENVDQQKKAETAAKQKATLDNIQELQDMERKMYVNLEVGAASRTPDLNEQKDTIDKVNQLSEMRAKLYQQLGDNYRYLSNNVAETRNNLVNQTAVTKIVEGELNTAKKQLRTLNDAKYNKLRMVEINTYQAQKTAAYKRMISIVVLACIPLILITLLYNNNIVNDSIAISLFLFIVIATVLYLAYLGVDITMRDNMNFDEYAFSFDKQSVNDRITNHQAQLRMIVLVIHLMQVEW